MNMSEMFKAVADSSSAELTRLAEAIKLELENRKCNEFIKMRDAIIMNMNLMANAFPEASFNLVITTDDNEPMKIDLLDYIVSENNFTYPLLDEKMKKVYEEGEDKT